MATLFSDDFTRANSDTIGNGWVERTDSSGNVQIQSNAVTTSGFGGNQYNTMYNATGITGADYTVQATNTPRSFAANGIVGRRVDFGAGADSDFYALEVVHGNPESAYLLKRVSGSFTTLATSGSTYDFTTSHTVKLSMQGTSLLGYIDGASDISVTDSSLSAAGDFGGMWYPGTWDDFLVEDFGGAGAMTPAAIAGTSTFTVTMNVKRALTVASVAGSSTVTASMAAKRAMTVAPVSGTSTATASLNAVRLLTVAPIAGAGSFTADLGKTGLQEMTATFGGTGTFTASLTAVTPNTYQPGGGVSGRPLSYTAPAQWTPRGRTRIRDGVPVVEEPPVVEIPVDETPVVEAPAPEPPPPLPTPRRYPSLPAIPEPETVSRETVIANDVARLTVAANRRAEAKALADAALMADEEDTIAYLLLAVAQSV